MATRTKKRTTDGRSASQKTEKYRFAQNVDGEETVAEQGVPALTPRASGRRTTTTPDVLLDVPVVKIDSAPPRGRGPLRAGLAADEGARAARPRCRRQDPVDKLKIDLKGVEAQALLKVRLDHVSAIVDRLMTTLDRNPDLVDSIAKAVEQVGSGAGHTLGEAGEAEEHIGEGTEDAVEQMGGGAGRGGRRRRAGRRTGGRRARRGRWAGRRRCR